MNINFNFIDAELNSLEYNLAIMYDRRTYLRYYYSLLQRKHLIFLTFCSWNDYNAFWLKFSLFILSFSLFFQINTLFFKDSTMNKIYTDGGKFNFIYQIPQIIYSTLLSSIITFILKYLSLTQKIIIKMKQVNNYKIENTANNVQKCIEIKMYIFLVIGLILILFFWYYLTAFGAVYINTQSHLITDIILSFGLSMGYPLFINLIPGLLRFPALKNKNKKCLYNFSVILGMF